MQATLPGGPRDWLEGHAARGVSTEAAVAFYDALPAVHVSELFGRWRGSGLPTGHPWDGLLEATGWYGKEFIDAENVHPLLFSTGGGRVVAVSPRLAPFGLLSRLRSPPPLPRIVLGPLLALFTTHRSAARLRMTEHRGVVTATMIYDHHPIHDVFRRVDADTVLGWMDLRGLERPVFFVLRRER